MGGVIELFGGVSFSVYLIHEHPCIKQILWNMVNPVGVLNSNGVLMTYIYLLVIILVLFLIALIAEKTRLLLFKVIKINAAFGIITRFEENHIHNQE